jgi:hypothetical protein
LICPFELCPRNVANSDSASSSEHPSLLAMTSLPHKALRATRPAMQLSG